MWWSIAVALAAPDPRCVEPALADLGSCLASADPEHLDRLIALAESALDGPERERTAEALRAAVISGSAEVRAAVAALMVRRGTLSAAAAARLPDPREVADRMQRALRGAETWPAGAPVDVGLCVLSGEVRPGTIALSCSAHACASACIAHRASAAFEIDANGWRTTSLSYGASDDGSCGCCMFVE